MRHEREVSLPVTAVTVLEDRAQVTRRARLRLDAGHHRLRIVGFSPVVCDRTLVAQVSDGADVVDVRVHRRHRDPSARDEVVVALEEKRRVLGLEQTSRRRARERLAFRLDDLGEIARTRMHDLADDVGHNRPPPEDFVASMDRLLQERRALSANLTDLDAEVARHSETMADLDHRIARRRERPDDVIAAVTEIDLATASDGEFELRLDYVVANACWRPYHRVTVDGEHLTFETEGCIWQNTGELWADVEIALSTERRSLGIEPPDLGTDQLHVRRRPTTMRVETREHEVERAAVEGAPTTEGLAGVDDGGEPQVQRVDAPVTIPSDGRPHRVPLGDFSAHAAIERVAYPELAPVVHRVAKLENRGSMAVLAGPVDVVLDGGLSGRTKLGYVGPGEAFELGLGPDADLRVRRETDQKRDEQFRISSYVRTHHEVRIRLSNLGDGTPKIRIVERVPVSEVEKLRIHVDERRTTDEAGPDKDGFIDWDRVLSRRGTASLVLRYTVERHHDVVMT